MSTSRAAPVIELRNLSTAFQTPNGAVRAVDGVSLSLGRGKTLGIVGESGCGKSMLALSIMGLVPQPGRNAGGEIVFDGRDLLQLSPGQMRGIRGNHIAMIFQEPMTSLNPVHTVGYQLVEALRAHRRDPLATLRVQALEALHKVRIPSPERCFDEYPHQLSGGMRQRVMIAMAVVCKPALLIADEPTTALDVTIQAQILKLLHELQEETAMSMILITHDLGVVSRVADAVAVMYAGKIVEHAPVDAVFNDPQHPYTIGLMGSIPQMDQEVERLVAIDGIVPPPWRLPPGCRFNPRCPFSDAVCRAQAPTLVEIAPTHYVACRKVPLEDCA